MKYLILLAIAFTMGCSQSSNTNKTSEDSGDVYFIDVSMLSLDINGESLPISLNLGSTLTNKEISDKIIIKNTKSTPIALSLVMENSPFKVKLNRCGATLAVGKSCEITVAFKSRGLYDNTYSGELTLGSELPSIMLNAAVVGSPDPNTSGTPVLTMELDSPFSPKTSESFRTLTVKNEGTGVAKNISLGVTSNYNIRLNRCPANLSPKSVCTIQVSQKNFRNTQPVDEPMTLSVPSLPPITLTTISLSSNGGGNSSSPIVFFDTASSPVESNESYEDLEKKGDTGNYLFVMSGDTISFKVTATESFLFEKFSFYPYPLKIRDKNNNLIFDGIGGDKDLAIPIEVQAGDFLNIEVFFDDYWPGNGQLEAKNQGVKAVISEVKKNEADLTNWYPPFIIRKKIHSLYTYKTICDESFGPKTLKITGLSAANFETEGYNYGETVQYVKSEISFDSLGFMWTNFPQARYENPVAYWQSPDDSAKKALLRQNPAIDAAVIAQEFEWHSQIGMEYQFAIQDEEMNHRVPKIINSHPYTKPNLPDLVAMGDFPMNGFSCITAGIFLTARNPFILKKITIPAQ